MGSPASTPAAALGELTEWTADVHAAIVLDDEGALLAAEPEGNGLGERLRELTGALLERADAAGGECPAEVEVATPNGAVYVVRAGHRTVAVMTGRLALSSLMRYDARQALAGLEQPAR